MHTVYFATNRKLKKSGPKTDFTGDFSADGLANLRFGEAMVNERGRVEGVNVYEETPDLSTRGSHTLFESLRQRMIESESDVIIFIHGFNVSFKSALHAAARLRERYQPADAPKTNVVAFRWPSDGKATYYRSDRLGSDGPRLPMYLPPKVTVVDCTPVVHGAVEHSYFVERTRVVQDVVETLSGKPSDQINGREFEPTMNRYRLLV